MVTVKRCVHVDAAEMNKSMKLLSLAARSELSCMIDRNAQIMHLSIQPMARSPSGGKGKAIYIFKVLQCFNVHVLQSAADSVRASTCATTAPDHVILHVHQQVRRDIHRPYSQEDH